ncbi:unnamed protein product [Mytilus edulis]|uniref:Uncharacterized protein n=1 Tax=Mytilus edulis TaxID=6550 RepID=A0A8S3RLT6_MYTED|nr:unnamed protein product [Mytilus edulis]
MEKNNEIHDETISVDGSIDMEDDNETASPQKRLKFRKNNQSLDDYATQKRLYQFVGKMTSDDESNMMEKEYAQNTVETSEESELMYITQAETFQEHTQLNSNYKPIDDYVEFDRPTDAVVENKSIQEIYTCTLCKYTTNIKCYYYKHLRKGHTSHTDTINNKRQKLNVDPSINSEPSSIPKNFYVARAESHSNQSMD